MGIYRLKISILNIKNKKAEEVKELEAGSSLDNYYATD